MSRRWNPESSNKRLKFRLRAIMRLAAVACVLLVASASFGQQPQPEPQAEPEHPASPPGLLETLGRWFGDSKAKIDDQIKSTTDAAKDAGQATGAILGLPGARVAVGRQRCAVAANGAPDCVAAAAALCRSKGMGPGKSLEVNTAQKCPAWVWLSGRPAPEGVCATETFVLRAMCQ